MITLKILTEKIDKMKIIYPSILKVKSKKNIEALSSKLIGIFIASIGFVLDLPTNSCSARKVWNYAEKIGMINFLNGCSIFDHSKDSSGSNCFNRLYFSILNALCVGRQRATEPMNWDCDVNFSFKK